jgi:hypothetical protein
VLTEAEGDKRRGGLGAPWRVPSRTACSGYLPARWSAASEWRKDGTGAGGGLGSKGPLRTQAGLWLRHLATLLPNVCSGNERTGSDVRVSRKWLLTGLD